MRKLLIITYCLISTYNLFGQDRMIVDETHSGNTFYGGFSKFIDSTLDLPTVIQFNLNGYLKKILGTMNDSLTFSHGQIIDLESKFKTDSITYRNEWVIPKYDLNFVLRDVSIGIKNYYIQIRLDEYGQILYSNWPKKNHSDKSQLKNLIDIEKFALKQAEIKGFDKTNYKVDFKYNKKLDTLCWIFNFPTNTNKDKQEYNAIEISWNFMNIVNEYKTVVTTVY